MITVKAGSISGHITIYLKICTHQSTMSSKKFLPRTKVKKSLKQKIRKRPQKVKIALNLGGCDFFFNSGL
jgi:hypothetical protein